MSIITLTTDFGLKDSYVANLKGLLYSRKQDVNIVDISHHIEVFNIQSAAFQVKNCWQSFPDYTIHFIWVGDQIHKKTNWIACKAKNHFFVLPNNGLITLILGSSPEQVVGLTNEEKLPLQEYLTTSIIQIAEEQSILGVGNHQINYLERLEQQPIVSRNLIRGQIIHIDHYGNLITNISKEFFESQREEEDRFELITRSIQLSKIRQKYSLEEPGEVVALFNSSNYLQISINQGNASKLLGLRIGDPVQIEFK